MNPASLRQENPPAAFPFPTRHEQLMRHHAMIRKNRQKGCNATTFLAIFLENVHREITKFPLLNRENIAFNLQTGSRKTDYI